MAHPRPALRAGLLADGRTIRRGFIAVRLRAAGVGLVAVSAHLGLSAGERERHARELTDALAGFEEPLVLGADLNEGPEGIAARWISARAFDCFARTGEGSGETFPARAPTARIDYLFVGQGIAPVRAWVGRAELAVGGSDHRPVVAELEIPG